LIECNTEHLIDQTQYIVGCFYLGSTIHALCRSKQGENFYQCVLPVSLLLLF